jgi:hypothetical protein
LQLKEIGQHSCGQKPLSLQDLQLYQQNQNAKIGFRALGAASNPKIRFVPPTSTSEKTDIVSGHEKLKKGLLLGKDKNIGGNGNNCVSHFGLQPKVIVFGTSAFS